MAISNKYSAARPSLYLNFYKSRQLDPRVSITRTSTGTYIDAEGMLRTAGPNEPRFNYENGECRGLLVEQSSTNLFLYSNDPSYGAIVQGSSTTSNYATSPDETLTATRWKVNSGLVDPGNSDYTVRMYKSVNSTAGQKVTQSLFVKPIKVISRYINPPDTSESDRDVYITLSADQGGYGSFNLRTFETVGQLTVQKLSNGWYRISSSYTVANNDSDNNHFINLGNRAGSFDPYPDGSEEVYIWGWQVEQSTSVTSYIPTTSTTVTRAADKVTINDLSWFDDTEGTFVVDTDLIGFSTTTTLFSVDNGSSQILYNGSKVKVGTGKTIYNPILTSDDTQRIVGYSSSKNLVITSSSDEPAFFSTTTSLPTGMNRLAIGWDPLNSNNYLNGPIKSLRYYPTLLDDTQLKTLVKINQDQTIEEIKPSSFIGIGTTTGLVLNLDSADPSSYSPETNIWYDLSGNSNHATLYNSPLYSSSEGGSIRFDTSQYGYVSPSATTTFNASTSYTISLWFQLNESSRSGLDTLFEGNGGARIWMYVNGNNYLTFNTYYGPPNPAGGYFNDYYQGVGSISGKNKWYNALVIHDKTNLKQRTYLNGNLTSEITLLSGYTFITNSEGGFYINNGTFGLAGSRFGIVQVYNRVLSNTEISNHVNNLRDRFGL